MEKVIADVKNFLSDESQDKISFAAGGSGWGFSANVSYSKEEARKKSADNGWKIDQVGKKYIPKSITVRDLNRQNINAHAGFIASGVDSAYSVRTVTSR